MNSQSGRSPNRVSLGRVSGLFGVRGWVKVYSYTDPRDGLLGYRDCQISRGDGWEATRIAEGKRHGKGIILRLEGVEDRDAAAELIGKELAVDREALPPPEDGSYYWRDLEGLEVRHTDGKLLGTVDYLLETGANDVLVVKNEAKEILIPFVTDAVIKSVDLTGGIIVADWEWD